MPTDTKTDASTEAGRDAARPERFEDILARLRGLVDRLEGGNLPLEDSLRAFEDGMELCRRGTVILDGAEKKVEMLLAAGRTAPFEHEDKNTGDK
jgi:exodeoxyribonuclease VII small subunit